MDTTELRRLRREMDLLNRDLRDLLQARARLAARIADEKHHLGLPMVDEAREAAMLDAVVADAPDGFDRATLRSLFAAIVAASRALVVARHPR